jgi:cytidine deaminase
MNKPDPQLLQAARDARSRAYAPYSNFHVGAALRSADGTVYSGCNVENASYGLTICAERNAIFHMVAAGKKEFTEIVIIGDSPGFLSPCGACRQVMSEFAKPETPVWMSDRDGNARSATMGELLPAWFFLDGGSTSPAHREP